MNPAVRKKKMRLKVMVTLNLESEWVFQSSLVNFFDNQSLCNRMHFMTESS